MTTASNRESTKAEEPGHPNNFFSSMAGHNFRKFLAAIVPPHSAWEAQ